MPPQTVLFRSYSIPFAPAATGKLITGACWSAASGYVPLFGGFGGVNVIAQPPVAPGAPFRRARVAVSYGMSVPPNASVRQLVAFWPLPEPVAEAPTAAA